MSPSDLLIVTGYDNQASNWGRIGARSWSLYAASHGFSFFCARAFPPFQHPSWAKLSLLITLLKRWDDTTIWWTDADSVCTNFRHDLLSVAESLLSTHPDKHLFASLDWSHFPDPTLPSTWSAGHLLIRNSPQALDFLSLSKTRYAAQYANTPSWDQSAMHALERALLASNPNSSPVFTLPRRTWNSVPIDCQPDGSLAEPWQPNDFLAHVTGVSDPAQRTAKLRYYEDLGLDTF